MPTVWKTPEGTATASKRTAPPPVEMLAGLRRYPFLRRNAYQLQGGVLSTTATTWHREENRHSDGHLFDKVAQKAEITAKLHRQGSLKERCSRTTATKTAREPCAACEHHKAAKHS